MKINENLKIAVGIDIGHSKVKCGFALSDAPNKHIMLSFPTVVIDYFEHSSEETRIKIERDDMVELGGKRYFFGDTALAQGTASTYTGQEKDWIKTTEHDVLIAGAWHKIHQELEKIKKDELPSGYVLVFGLPTKYYSSLKPLLEARIDAVLKPLLKKGQVMKVLIKAQSEAPFSCLAFEEDGSLSKEHQMNKENWASLEMGHFSGDLSVWYNGQILHRLSDSTYGTQIVYSKLDELLSAKYPTNLNGVLANMVETKTIFFNGSMHDVGAEVEQAAMVLQRSLLEKLKTQLSDHKNLLHGIIISGGGTPLIFDAIKKEYPNAVKIPKVDPRNVVLESFIRMGLYAANVKKIV